MIDYKHFQFASAPRTGTTWFMKTCTSVGLGEGFKSHVHVPAAPGCRFRVSIVRHPCDWLCSFYSSIYPGKIGLPELDVFSKLESRNFNEFIANYLDNIPGAIYKLFMRYESDSYLITSDLKYGFLELTESAQLSIPPSKVNEGPENFSKRKPDLLPWHREVILSAEKQLCDHFGFY